MMRQMSSMRETGMSPSFENIRLTLDSAMPRRSATTA
jgi:hypothetical protein